MTTVVEDRPDPAGASENQPGPRQPVPTSSGGGDRVFILVPHITPGGLDEFADRVIPILQARGSFRADYEGETLRDHLGVGAPTTAGPVARAGS